MQESGMIGFAFLKDHENRIKEGVLARSNIAPQVTFGHN